MAELLHSFRRWLSGNYRRQGMGHVDMDGKYFQAYCLLRRRPSISDNTAIWQEKIKSTHSVETYGRR
jgi:hypothetical protein